MLGVKGRWEGMEGEERGGNREKGRWEQEVVNFCLQNINSSINGLH